MCVPLVEMERVSVMNGDALVLTDVTLSLRSGQSTAILGPNGSGKSTLVKLIARQLYPLHGARIRVFGRRDWSVKELQGSLGIVSDGVQRDYTNNERVEVFEAVASSFYATRGLWNRHEVSREIRERSQDALRQMGVSHLVGRDLSTLSTGEARRVLIARAIAHQPKALLLDEPCSGLDPVARRRFLETLRQLAQAGTTLLLVTHHIEEVLPEIDHLVMMKDGRLIRSGPKAELMQNEIVSCLFDAPIRVDECGQWYSAHLQ